MKPTTQEQLSCFAIQQQHAKSLPLNQVAADTPVRAADANTASSEIAENDVLCGRGGLTNSHIGNKHYRQIVQDHQAEYLKARKRDKITIAQRIVAIIHDNGGRFLKRSADGESWVLVTDKKAQEKTSQALREGLDVRNKKIRPSKQIRRDDDSVESDGGRRRKYKSTVAPGKVIASAPSPTVVAPTTEPTLSEEPPAPAPLFLPYERQISQSDIRDACEI